LTAQTTSSSARAAPRARSASWLNCRRAGTPSGTPVNATSLSSTNWVNIDPKSSWMSRAMRIRSRLSNACALACVVTCAINRRHINTAAAAMQSNVI
jgi:hypothetical protein